MRRQVMVTILGKPHKASPRRTLAQIGLCKFFIGPDGSAKHASKCELREHQHPHFNTEIEKKKAVEKLAEARMKAMALRKEADEFALTAGKAKIASFSEGLTDEQKTETGKLAKEAEDKAEAVRNALKAAVDVVVAAQKELAKAIEKDTNEAKSVAKTARDKFASDIATPIIRKALEANIATSTVSGHIRTTAEIEYAS